jgi:hypothetical protein
VNKRAWVVLAVATFAVLGVARPFGRFGYGSVTKISGFQVDRTGFQVADPLADKILFSQPVEKWDVESITNTQQTISTGSLPGIPSKVRTDLFSPGFWLYFEKGIRLRICSTASPYLSWDEGSVGKDLPTPDTRWMVVSFQEKQFPLVLGFPDAPCSLKITGKPANWVLASGENYQGWVHVGLPMGMKSVSANSAASLGVLTESMHAQESLYAEPAPAIKGLTIEEDRQSVTATWSFDRPGAVVPPAAILAPIGDYPISILSPVVSISAPTIDGPLAVCKGRELKIRFPVRRIPTGRALALGLGRKEPIGTVSPDDVPSIFDLAVENLLSPRDTQTRKAAEDALAEFLANASLTEEPSTKQLLPYAASGVGIDLAAAHALLMQSLTSTKTATSEANSLLTSLSWRTDWSTWLVSVDDVDLARRAGCIGAVAAAMCPEPERRLSAGQWQAGLAAQRGLGLWRRRNGFSQESPQWLEAALGVRQGLFGLRDHPVEGRAFGDVLASPIRVYGDLSVTLAGDKSPYTLAWNAIEAKSTVLTLAASYPLHVDAKTNLDRLKIGQALGLTELRMIPTIAGLAELSVTIPSWAGALPFCQSVPAYTEIRR